MKIKTLSLGIFSLIFFSALIYIGAFHSPQTIHAATITVCASGCDQTTITAAIAAATDDNGDIIDVQSGYVETGEAFPLTVDKSVEIDCSNVEAIGNISNADVMLITDTDVTIENCELDKVEIRVSASDVTINSNTIDTSGATFITTTGNDADSLTITNNTALNGVWIEGKIDSTNISSNTFEIRYKGTSRQGISLNGMISDTTIDDNSVTNYSSARTNYKMIELKGSSGNPVGTGNTITNNIISFSTDPGSEASGEMITANSAAAVTISGNYISLPTASVGSYAGIALGSEFGPLGATVQNNTIKLSGTCGADCRAIYGSDHNVSNALVSTIEYNIFYSLAEISEASVEGMFIAKNHDDSTITITDNYNGYYNTTGFIGTEGTYEDEIATTATNRYTMSPGMKIGDVDSTNDMDPFPASCYLDVNGGTDIGAFSGARRSAEDDGKIHIEVDDDGTINYSTVDFTSIDSALAAACTTGSSVDVATGTYAEQVGVNTKTVNLIGAGSGSTTINSAGINSDAALWLANIDNSTISGFTITADATDYAALLLSSASDGNTFTDLILSGITSPTTAYAKTYHPYEYDGNDYDEGILMAYQIGEVDNYYTIDENDEDITSIITDGSQETWNLGLVNDGNDREVPLRYTLYWNDADYPDATTAKDALDAAEKDPGDMTWIVDCWVDDVYVYSNGLYKYTAPTGGTSGCSASAPTAITSGYQTSPETSAIIISRSGNLSILSSDTNTFSNSTVQDGTYGISFIGFSGYNTIDTTNITFTGNTTDIYTSSTISNTITTNDYCASFTYIVGLTGALAGCNTAPTVSVNSATQTADTNTVAVSIEVDDYDEDDTKVRVEYERPSDGACDGPWATATLSGTATADYSDSGGVPDIASSGEYQAGSTATTRIITTSGSNTVAFNWNASEDIGEDGTQCLRITANDDTLGTTTPATQTVSYTYVGATLEAEETGASTYIVSILSAAIEQSTADTEDISSKDEKDEEIEEDKEAEEETEEEIAEPVEYEPSDAEIESEKNILEEATKTVTTTVTEVVTEKIESYEIALEEKPIEEEVVVVEEIKLETAKAKEAIEEYLEELEKQEEPVEDPAESGEEEKIKTAPELVTVATGEITEKAKEMITEKVLESTTAILKTDETVEVYIAGKKKIVEDREELAEILEEIDFEKSDIDGDGISDALAVAKGIALFDENQDGDAYITSTEIYCGLDPTEKDELETTISNLEEATVGKNPIFRICSKVPGEKYEIFLIEKEKEDQLYIGKGIIGEDYKGALVSETEIPDGEYFILTKIGKEEEIGVSSFTVNNEIIPPAPTIEVSGVAKTLGKTIHYVIALNGEMVSDFDAKEFIETLAEDPVVGIERYMVKGTAEPGIIYVTYKSRILSSVVISDASQGEFEAEIPADLSEGEHEVLVYLHDEENNLVSNVTRLLFSK